MTKFELIKAVKEKMPSDIPLVRVEEMFDALVDCMVGALKSGENVKIAGFGSFSVVQRAARQGRNPQTGKTIQIAARKAVKFTSGSAVKNALN